MASRELKTRKGQLLRLDSIPARELSYKMSRVRPQDATFKG